MLLLMAAAVTSLAQHAPIPRNPRGWIVPEDYPAGEVRAGSSAAVNVRLVVAPDGRPVTCTVLTSVDTVGATAATSMGNLTCALLLRRATFVPASDAAGAPIYGTYSAWLAYRTGKGMALPPPVQDDFEIKIASMPDGLPDPAYVNIDVAVGIDGVVGACNPASGNKSETLARVACQQLASFGKLTAAKDKSGAAVASIQRVGVQFTVTGSKNPAPK